MFRRHLASRRSRPRSLAIDLAGLAGLAAVLTAAAGCHTTSAPAIETPPVEQIRQQLDEIAPPSKSQYMAVHSLRSWQNPYLTVQSNMVTLHVTLGDANTSDLGQGGMLRPVGARRQDVTLRADALAAALNALPRNSWPYGRVVAVEEAHGVPPSARPEVRRNLETVMKVLGDVGVVAYEWTEGGAGLH